MLSSQVWPAPPDLWGLVDISYSLHVWSTLHPVIPDGRAGIVWLSDGTVRICGPETRAWNPERSGVDVVGVRLSLGATPAVLGVPAHELVDRRIALQEIWGPAALLLAERVTAAAGARARVVLLEDAVRGGYSRSTGVDPVARAVVRRLSVTTVSVRQLAADSGLSERQLGRRCHAAFGYPISMLARLLRLQRFLSLARSTPASNAGLAALAAGAGYSDQAHLARDCGSLAGFRPSTLRKAVQGWPGVMSDPMMSDPFKSC